MRKLSMKSTFREGQFQLTNNLFPIMIHFSVKWYQMIGGRCKIWISKTKILNTTIRLATLGPTNLLYSFCGLEMWFRNPNFTRLYRIKPIENSIDSSKRVTNVYYTLLLQSWSNLHKERTSNWAKTFVVIGYQINRSTETVASIMDNIYDL